MTNLAIQNMKAENDFGPCTEHIACREAVECLDRVNAAENADERDYEFDGMACRPGEGELRWDRHAGEDGKGDWVAWGGAAPVRLLDDEQSACAPVTHGVCDHCFTAKANNGSCACD